MGDMVEELLVIKQLVLSRETRPSNHSLWLVRILMETMMGDMVVEESLVIKQFVLSRHISAQNVDKLTILMVRR